MCGITGFWDLTASTDKSVLMDVVTRMTDTLTPRGPDDGGIWVDPRTGMALGHRRLSIVDLSPLGHQPMLSASGRSAIVYNGEIFNFQEIRADLVAAGHSLRGHSDTEVLLEACEAWGVEKSISRCIGMFAFAFWDMEKQCLTLARDRLGIKPLFWGRLGQTIFFGSQPKSFFPHPDWRPVIDRRAMAAFMAYSYVPAPHSIYQGIAKLRPGRLCAIKRDGEVRETIFWDLQNIIAHSRQTPYVGTPSEAVEELELLLRDAVRRRMVADVPLGAFLSGGVDSSTVVALMQVQSQRPVKTFSIGFHEQGHNEAPFARAVAEHLGTDHTELYVEPAHALDLVPGLPDLYDEPFSDASQIPTYLVSALTRQKVTVALSGDGGDELFAGYTRYLMAARLRRIFQFLPRLPRQWLALGLCRLSPATWDQVARLIPAGSRPTLLGDKLHKLSEILALDHVAQIYPQLLSFWPLDQHLVRGEKAAMPLPYTDATLGGLTADTERMQLLDILTYLPDDILAKVDRASMAVGLEARVPLLDHRVVEFAWRLPLEWKIRNGQSKWPLRQILYRYVPAHLIERPKMGFGVPIDGWLRGPLREWAEDLLDSRRMQEDGLFDPLPIRQRWTEHLSGVRNWQYSLWGVLMAQAWKRHWIDKPSTGASDPQPVWINRTTHGNQ
ncbi:MAG: asparagine synthase (glutamine-hydrolyzing) [Magnetococcus sp. DMHC-1]|nr:asparagine synthase (glutamine-hydrolyzing) [Magnetococcales bacterium]